MNPPDNCICPLPGQAPLDEFIASGGGQCQVRVDWPRQILRHRLQQRILRHGVEAGDVVVIAYGQGDVAWGVSVYESPVSTHCRFGHHARSS